VGIWGALLGIGFCLLMVLFVIAACRVGADYDKELDRDGVNPFFDLDMDFE
jgi:hypothetical protein